MSKRVLMPYINGERINKELDEGWIPTKLETIFGVQVIHFIRGTKGKYSCNIVDEELTWAQKNQQEDVGNFLYDPGDDFITNEYTDKGSTVHRLHLQRIPHKTFTKADFAKQFNEVKSLAGTEFSIFNIVFFTFILGIANFTFFNSANSSTFPLWLLIAIYIIGMLPMVTDFAQWLIYWIKYKKINKR